MPDLTEIASYATGPRMPPSAGVGVVDAGDPGAEVWLRVDFRGISVAFLSGMRGMENCEFQ